MLSPIGHSFCDAVRLPPCGDQVLANEEEPQEGPSLQKLLEQFNEDYREELVKKIEDSKEKKELIINLSNDFSDDAIKTIIENLTGILTSDVKLFIELKPTQLYLLNEQNTKDITHLSIEVVAKAPHDFLLISDFSNKFLRGHTLTVVLTNDLEGRDWQDFQKAFCTFLMDFKSQHPLYLEITDMSIVIANMINAFMYKESYNPANFGLNLIDPSLDALDLLPPNIPMDFLSITIHQIDANMIEELLQSKHLTMLTIDDFSIPDEPPLEEIGLLSSLRQTIHLSITLQNIDYVMPSDLFYPLQHHLVTHLDIYSLTQAQFHQIYTLFPYAVKTYSQLITPES